MNYLAFELKQWILQLDWEDVSLQQFIEEWFGTFVYHKASMSLATPTDF